MRQKQIERTTSLMGIAKEIREQLLSIEDMDKADIVQRQSVDRAIRDLKKAGAHVGYSNADRHCENAAGRLKGVAATNEDVSVSVEEIEEAA